MNDFKGIRDPYLNVYWQYSGKPYLENNITKAFINALDSLSEADFRTAVSSIFGLGLKKGALTREFYLQKKPDEAKVKGFAIDRRIMFAFNPDGECWGFSGQDIKDENALFKAIKSELAKDYQDEKQLLDETKKAVEEYLNAQRGDSIPDGWVFIYIDGQPEYVIALENKLHKLDPNQLNNHIEKSLFVEKEKKPVVYRKYEEIIKALEPLDSYLANQFIEYLILLGYWKVDDFSLACSADPGVRTRLALNFGKEILSALSVDGGYVDNRKWNVVRRHVRYDYLREINLIFDPDGIRLSLAFGSTRNSGRAMVRSLDSFDLPSNHLALCKQSFHLAYSPRGRNIPASYVDCAYPLNDYIRYLKENVELIETLTPNEAIALYGKLLKDGFIAKRDYEALSNHLSSKRSKVSVIPEIYCEYVWTYKELSKTSAEGFAFELDCLIHEVLKAAKLVDGRAS